MYISWSIAKKISVHEWVIGILPNQKLKTLFMSWLTESPSTTAFREVIFSRIYVIHTFIYKEHELPQHNTFQYIYWMKLITTIIECSQNYTKRTVWCISKNVSLWHCHMGGCDMAPITSHTQITTHDSLMIPVFGIHLAPMVWHCSSPAYS